MQPRFGKSTFHSSRHIGQLSCWSFFLIFRSPKTGALIAIDAGPARSTAMVANAGHSGQ